MGQVGLWLWYRSKAPTLPSSALKPQAECSPGLRDALQTPCSTAITQLVGTKRHLDIESRKKADNEANSLETTMLRMLRNAAKSNACGRQTARIAAGSSGPWTPLFACVGDGNATR